MKNFIICTVAALAVSFGFVAGSRAMAGWNDAPPPAAHAACELVPGTKLFRCDEPKEAPVCHHFEGHLFCSADLKGQVPSNCGFKKGKLVCS